jgi:hypothetical protein
MPVSKYGQLITFAIERDADLKLTKWRWVNTKRGDTVRKIATRLGHPELAREIADENLVRSVDTILNSPPIPGTTLLWNRQVKKLKVPALADPSLSFSVLAGDVPPQITGGYAKLSIVDRPGRVGVTMFEGYDPVTMEVPVRFETPRGSREGLQIEKDIALLERMAGRGDFPGAAVGPPPIIRVSTTDADGNIVPLIPRNYQWSPQNKTAPTWRVAGIEWDAEPRRNDAGNRIRQLAVVTLQQHTNVRLLARRARR